MDNIIAGRQQPKIPQPVSAIEEETYWDLIGRCLGTQDRQLQAEDICAHRINEALQDNSEPELQDTALSRSSSSWSVSLIDFEEAAAEAEGKPTGSLARISRDLERSRGEGSDWIDLERRSSDVSEDCLVSSLSSPSVESDGEPQELEESQSSTDTTQWRSSGTPHPRIARVELGWPFNEEAFEHAVKAKMEASKSPSTGKSSRQSWSESGTAEEFSGPARIDAEEELERILHMLAIEDGLGSRDFKGPLARGPTPPPPVFRRATVPMITIPPRPTFGRTSSTSWSCKDTRGLVSPSIRPLVYYSTRTPGIGGQSPQVGYFTSTLMKASEGPIPPSLLKRQSYSPILDVGSLPPSPLLCNGRMIVPFDLIRSPSGSSESSRSGWETTDDESGVATPVMFTRPGTPRPMDIANLIDRTACHDKAFNPYFMDAEM